MRGDGFQNGGLLVVEKGGKVLYTFIQENPADHASNEDVLKVDLSKYFPCSIYEQVNTPLTRDDLLD